MEFQRFKIAIWIASLCAVAFLGEYAYNMVHVKRGPNGWFAVDVTVNAYKGIHEDLPAYAENVVRGPFASVKDCNAWIGTHAVYHEDYRCKRLRFDDAAREGWSGTAP